MIHAGECRHCGRRLPHEAEFCSECNRLWCGECGCVTNHTTEQHEEAAYSCQECGEPVENDDPEARLCTACWQEYQEWRFAEWVDNQAKEANHGEGTR